jgi:hypothetical protein
MEVIAIFAIFNAPLETSSGSFGLSDGDQLLIGKHHLLSNKFYQFLVDSIK